MEENVVQNKMFLRSNGVIVEENSMLKDSMRFRDWMRRKRSRNTTSFGFFEFDQDYSENQISSSSSSEDDEKMEVVEEEEEDMSEDVKLFVELTSGSVGDVRRLYIS